MTEFEDSSKRTIFSKLADWWLEKSRYSEDIKALRSRLVDASLQIYTNTLKALLPTPTRSHYTFNLRDLSKIFQGLETAGATLKDTESVVRLWAHEALRVFSDRLVDEGDRSWFAAALASACEEHFRVKWCVIQPMHCISLQNTDWLLCTTHHVSIHLWHEVVQISCLS